MYVDNLKLHAEFLHSLTDWNLLPGRQRCEGEAGMLVGVVAVPIDVQQPHF